MKKALLLIISLILATLFLASCGGNGGEETTKKKVVISNGPAKTEAPVADQNTTAPQQTYDPADYTKVVEFKAPTGDYREIAKKYMLSMFDFEWTPSRTFKVEWKEKGDFDVNLTYNAGTTYKGMIYSRTNGDLTEFFEYMDGKTFKVPETTYYEEIVGNHCSASMLMAYQQLINLPWGQLKPTEANRGLIKFPIDLEIPQGGEWYSKTLFDLNGKDKIFEAYKQLKTGDILYKNIEGSGHDRMVDYVEIVKNAAGQVVNGNCKVYTIEQTNAFESSKDKNFVAQKGYDTTWWIDHSYTFNELFETGFMPCTLAVYSSGEKLQDAYICYDGKNDAESFKTTLNGSVISNFPITYVLLRVTDANGNIVSEYMKNYIKQPYNSEYRINIRQFYDELMNKVPSGTYTFTLRAGIARGNCELDSFTFTK